MPVGNACSLVPGSSLGAWVLLEQVASQEPKAPSWQFLKSRWEALKGGAASNTQDAAEEGARLLWVISHSATRFPMAEAQALAEQLLQVRIEG